jgi:hypothetical protein
MKQCRVTIHITHGKVEIHTTALRRVRLEKLFQGAPKRRWEDMVTAPPALQLLIQPETKMA